MFPPLNGTKRLHEKLQSAWAKKYQNFQIYETYSRIFIFAEEYGKKTGKRTFRLLKLERDAQLTSLKDIVTEDYHSYTQPELNNIVETVGAASKEEGGILNVTVASIILGFVRFLQGYYLVLGTQKNLEGCIASHAVYSLENFTLLQIWKEKKPPAEKTFFGRLQQTVSSIRVTQTPLEVAEGKYRSCFTSIDFSKNFYFSYTYDLTQSIQGNFVKSGLSGRPSPDEFYVWNHFLTAEFSEVCSDHGWTAPLIYGSFDQQPSLLFGREFRLTLIGRRSRHFAGTRYLKRGCNDRGKVANEVDVEQILEDISEGRISSHVQNRGSIPVFWTQKTSATDPKPAIILPQSKGLGDWPLPLDTCFNATKLHFEDMIARYSSPVTCCNLIRLKEKKPREVLVGTRFREAVECINTTCPPRDRIEYIELDYKHLQSSGRGHYHLDALNELSEQSLKKTGFFSYNARRSPHRPTARDIALEIQRARIGEVNTLLVEGLKKDASLGRLAQRYFHGPSDVIKIDDLLKGRKAGTFVFWERRGERMMSLVSKDNFTVEHAVLWHDNDKQYVLSSGKRVASLDDVLEELPQLKIGVLNWKLVGRFDEEEIMLPRPAISEPPMATSAHVRNRLHSSAFEFDMAEVEPHHVDARMSMEATVRLQEEKDVILQRGVFRVNCIDCLDRTNVAQYCMGSRVLSKQLWAMGVDMRASDGNSLDASMTQKKPKKLDLALDEESQLVFIQLLMYEKLGDRLAIQYGGSQAHKKVTGQPIGSTEKSKAAKSTEMFTSFKRYVSNSFLDKNKQDAINLVLGHFVPHKHAAESRVKSSTDTLPKHLWDREGDYYWHNHAHEFPDDPSYDVMDREWWKSHDEREEERGTPPEHGESLLPTEEAQMPLEPEDPYELLSFDAMVGKTGPLSDLAVDLNHHGDSMTLTNQVEYERKMLDLEERGLAKSAHQCLTRIQSGDIRFGQEASVSPPKLDFWENGKEMEEPYVILPNNQGQDSGENFQILRESWEDGLDNMPTMTDVVFGSLKDYIDANFSLRQDASKVDSLSADDTGSPEVTDPSLVDRMRKFMPTMSPLYSNLPAFSKRIAGSRRASITEVLESAAKLMDDFEQPSTTNVTKEVETFDAKSVYSSYVSLGRYTDACYKNDADPKVFDVTGQRRYEIESYIKTYTRSESFVDNGADRELYFQNPDVECAMEFLLSQLFQEGDDATSRTDEPISKVDQDVAPSVEDTAAKTEDTLQDLGLL
jgi:hypothetical protein